MTTSNTNLMIHLNVNYIDIDGNLWRSLTGTPMFKTRAPLKYHIYTGDIIVNELGPNLPMVGGLPVYQDTKTTWSGNIIPNKKEDDPPEEDSKPIAYTYYYGSSKLNQLMSRARNIMTPTELALMPSPERAMKYEEAIELNRNIGRPIENGRTNLYPM